MARVSLTTKARSKMFFVSSVVVLLAMAAVLQAARPTPEQQKQMKDLMCKLKKEQIIAMDNCEKNQLVSDSKLLCQRPG